MPPMAKNQNERRMPRSKPQSIKMVPVPPVCIERQAAMSRWASPLFQVRQWGKPCRLHGGLTWTGCALRCSWNRARMHLAATATTAIGPCTALAQPTAPSTATTQTSTDMMLGAACGRLQEAGAQGLEPVGLLAEGLANNAVHRVELAL